MKCKIAQVLEDRKLYFIRIFGGPPGTHGRTTRSAVWEY